MAELSKLRLKGLSLMLIGKAVTKVGDDDGNDLTLHKSEIHFFHTSMTLVIRPNVDTNGHVSTHRSQNGIFSAISHRNFPIRFPTIKLALCLTLTNFSN